jgi:hypothetical protein
MKGKMTRPALVALAPVGAQESRATSSDWVTLPVEGVITLASPDTISLQCTATGALSEAFNWQLSAIEVGTVH